MADREVVLVLTSKRVLPALMIGFDKEVAKVTSDITLPSFPHMTLQPQRLDKGSTIQLQGTPIKRVLESIDSDTKMFAQFWKDAKDLQMIDFSNDPNREERLQSMALVNQVKKLHVESCVLLTPQAATKLSVSAMSNPALDQAKALMNK